jgi:hypothetical protein
MLGEMNISATKEPREMERMLTNLFPTMTGKTVCLKKTFEADLLVIAKEFEDLDDPVDEDMLQDLEGEISVQRTNRRLFDDADMSDVEDSQPSKSRRILDSDEEDVPRTRVVINDEDDFDFLERAINAASTQ